MYICIYICIYVYMYIYVYIYTHTHTHNTHMQNINAGIIVVITYIQSKINDNKLIRMSIYVLECV